MFHKILSKEVTRDLPIIVYSATKYITRTFADLISIYNNKNVSCIIYHYCYWLFII